MGEVLHFFASKEIRPESESRIDLLPARLEMPAVEVLSRILHDAAARASSANEDLVMLVVQEACILVAVDSADRAGISFRDSGFH